MLDFSCQGPGGPVNPGLRERQKADRRRRIEAAAKAVFHEKGYDAATTREIAARAEVSIGTLFAYARDKRDLLTMVYRDELHALTESTYASVPPQAPVLDQLIHMFEPRYAYWSSDTALARHALRETFAATYPIDGDANAATADAPEHFLLLKLVALIRAGQRDRRIKANDGPELIARVVLDIYLSENRAWLAQPSPLLDEGMTHLRAALELALRAVSPNRSGSKSSRTRSK
jgi:AcrR family transcriptional regulator